jgi:hypothetical protein
MRMLICAGLLAMGATPALGQSAEKVAEDAAMTPVEDVNLKRREIPPILLSAMDDPYSGEGTRSCLQINTTLGELDTVLGPDFDAATPEERRIRADKIAKGIVGSFIPFRSVIREVSGAAGAERRYQAALDAGLARRGYLRGIARQKGCKRPAAAVVASN